MLINVIQTLEKFVLSTYPSYMQQQQPRRTIMRYRNYVISCNAYNFMNIAAPCKFIKRYIARGLFQIKSLTLYELGVLGH